MSDNLNVKKETVKRVESLIKGSPIIGIVNMQNLPTAQLQRMRKKLNDSVTLFMAKKRLLKIALKNVSKSIKGIEKLDEYLIGMPALMLTKENPFKLYKLIQKNKSNAAAKGGQMAPSDITISAGPTPFTPGPIISELGAFGLKTKVNDGKIEIIEDKVVVQEGEEISNEMASLLSKLGIEPMEIGLDLRAVFENGDLFTKEVLDIDEDEYFNNFTKAHRWSFNLAVEAGILTSETTEFMIQKAAKNVKAVALEANFLTSETTDEILAKAEREMKSVENNVDFSKVPEPKEEAKVDESKEESKAEEPITEEVKEESVEEKSEETEKEVSSEESKE